VTEIDIIKKLRIIFQDVFDDESLTINNDTTAEDIDDWDSLEHINLIVAIEKDFKFKVTLGELQDLQNVGDMVGLIGKKVGRTNE
jgi:acyl carrier protein